MKRLLIGGVLSVAFAGSCVRFIPIAARIADPMTRRPLDNQHHEDFPVAVVQGERAWVVMVSDPRRIPSPPPGASYLVPPGRVRALQQSLNDLDTHPHDRTESSWMLVAGPITQGQQRIEVMLAGDGFWGGVYDATATTATARYRKLTGPGFALVFGPLALLLNVVVWGVGSLLFRYGRSRLQA